MSRWLIGTALVLALIASAIARFPLSVALALADAEAAGLSALRVEGSVWDGRMVRATLGDRLIGEVALGLVPAALLQGVLRVDWRLDRPGLSGTGRLLLGRGGAVAIEDARITGRLIGLPTLVPLEGEIRVRAERIVFGPNGCKSASARFWTDALARSRASLDWQGPVLEGRAACRDGALVLPLAGNAEQSRVAIEIRLLPELRYVAELTVATEDVRLRRRLPLLGFEAAGGGEYRLRQAGRLSSPRPDNAEETG